MQYRFHDSDWDLNSIECYPFYKADWREIDVVCVFDPEGKRVGFIVSQAVIFTEDSKILENSLLTKYLSCWLKTHLKCEFSELSNMIEDNLPVVENQCYLLLHKPSLSYLTEQDISIRAFMYSCCFLIEKDTSTFLSKETEKIQNEQIKNEKIKIFPVINNEASQYFLNECIPRVNTAIDALSQFVILYQYFEVLMEILFEPRLNLEYTKYKDRLISKNDFRQSVSLLSKESSLLAELLENISNKHFEIISDTERKRLSLDDSKKYSTSDFIYRCRNTIFHRTRFFLKEDDLLKKLNYAILKCIYECLGRDLV